MTTPAERLRRLASADLRRLHAAGTAPEPTRLLGPHAGAVLTGTLALPGIRALRVWRGKMFDQVDGEVVGVNRLGLGPLEVCRFDFVAAVAPSSFGRRDVVVLDHDRESNPLVVRQFHDELVQVEEGLYLATSHHWGRGRLSFLAMFALAAEEQGPDGAV